MQEAAEGKEGQWHTCQPLWARDEDAVTSTQESVRHQGVDWGNLIKWDRGIEVEAR